MERRNLIPEPESKPDASGLRLIKIGVLLGALLIGLTMLADKWLNRYAWQAPAGGAGASQVRDPRP